MRFVRDSKPAECCYGRAEYWHCSQGLDKEKLQKRKRKEKLQACFWLAGNAIGFDLSSHQSYACTTAFSLGSSHQQLKFASHSTVLNLSHVP